MAFLDDKPLDQVAKDFAKSALKNLKSDFVFPEFNPALLSDEDLLAILETAYVRGANDRVQSLFKQGKLHLKEAGK